MTSSIDGCQIIYIERVNKNLWENFKFNTKK